MILGTPHYSAAQIARLHTLLAGRPVHGEVTLYVNTGRDVLRSVSRTVEDLERLGVVFGSTADCVDPAVAGRV